MPDGMDGQQSILDRVFHVVWIAVPSRRERTQVGRDLMQESMIGGSVTILGSGHQNGPIHVADNRFRMICAVWAAALVRPNELQRRHAAARFLGHWQQAPRCGSAAARMSASPCLLNRAGITGLLAGSEADAAY